MANTQIVTGHESTILNFIGGLDKAFIIPPFQRNYEWTEKNCEELFRDIIIAINTGKSHYLGNIVYYIGQNSRAGYDEYILIDGQQRLTSILILLCALRDTIKDEDTIKSINQRYLFNDIKDNKYRIRLKQTQYDKNSFASLIEGKEQTRSNNIYKNYQLFLRLIEESRKDPIDIYNAITKLEIVGVSIYVGNDLRMIQTIFEKINSTGRKLSPADLIRNLLLISNSSEEQEYLYENYWLKIEETLKNENISTFARDYLVMKTYNDVGDDEIYFSFKKYLENNNSDRTAVLSELLKYAKLYAFIKFNNCPDKKIRYYLQLLSSLETKDVFPLYLSVLEKYYERKLVDASETHKIFETVFNYLARYRIVKPSGGGGTLRKVIQNLIKLLDDEPVKFNQHDILAYFSNSSTDAGRFPDDKEFKNKLKENNPLNHRYGRVLFYHLERATHKGDFTIDIKEITIEHIMPQKISLAWQKSLGGAEKAEETYKKYINCIGNLTPISGLYNSKMSNKIYSEKIPVLSSGLQFEITRDVPIKYLCWDESSIADRNELVATKLVKVISGPLPRTVSATIPAIAGIYKIEEDIPVTGTSLSKVCYEYDSELDEIECSAWRNLIVIIVNKIIEKGDKAKIDKLVSSNEITKRTGKHTGNKDPIITTNSKLLNMPINLDGTDYFIEGNISADRAFYFANKIAEKCNYINRFLIEISE